MASWDCALGRGGRGGGAGGECWSLFSPACPFAFSSEAGDHQGHGAADRGHQQRGLRGVHVSAGYMAGRRASSAPSSWGNPGSHVSSSLSSRGEGLTCPESIGVGVSGDGLLRGLGFLGGWGAVSSTPTGKDRAGAQRGHNTGLQLALQFHRSTGERALGRGARGRGAGERGVSDGCQAASTFSSPT